MFFSISKQSFTKLPGQLMPMNGVTSEVVTPRVKTKSNLLANLFKTSARLDEKVSKFGSRLLKT